MRRQCSRALDYAWASKAGQFERRRSTRSDRLQLPVMESLSVTAVDTNARQPPLVYSRERGGLRTARSTAAASLYRLPEPPSALSSSRSH